jgi:hypothetical protein
MVICFKFFNLIKFFSRLSPLLFKDIFQVILIRPSPKDLRPLYSDDRQAFGSVGRVWVAAMKEQRLPSKIIRHGRHDHGKCQI